MKTIFALTVAALGSGVCWGICLGELGLAERRIDRLFVYEGLVWYGTLALLAVGGVIFEGFSLLSRGDGDE